MENKMMLKKLREINTEVKEMLRSETWAMGVKYHTGDLNGSLQHELNATKLKVVQDAVLELLLDNGKEA